MHTKLAFVLAAAMGFGGMQVATAADMAVKARPLPVDPAYNWSGFYVGINGGYGWGKSDISAPISSGSYNMSGGLAGGTLGYNWQMGQAVIGLEGDIDWTHLHGNGPCAGTTCETRNDWLSTARGRIGYAFDRFMPFVSGGAA